MAHPAIPPFGKKRVTSMSDHDDSAEHPPADGVPEGPEDDKDSELGARSSFQTRPDKDPDDYFEFINLQGEDECFDIEEPIERDRLWYSRPDTPCDDEVLFGIEANRWVLVYGQLPGEEDDGSPNRELSAADASRWFQINRHGLPESLKPVPLRDPSGDASSRLSREWEPQDAGLLKSADASQEFERGDDDPREAAERMSKPPEAPPRAKEKRRVEKEPLEWEREAHEMWKLGKWTQQDIAENLSRRYHIPLDQSQVSRAKDKVAAWLGEPEPRRVPRGDRPRKYNMDPQKEQHVIEDDRPLLAEQTEARAIPIRNGLRMRRKEGN